MLSESLANSLRDVVTSKGTVTKIDCSFLSVVCCTLSSCQNDKTESRKNIVICFLATFSTKHEFHFRFEIFLHAQDVLKKED